jgi:hypothetical protein
MRRPAPSGQAEMRFLWRALEIPPWYFLTKHGGTK